MGKEADALESLRVTLEMPRLPGQLKIDPLQLTPEVSRLLTLRACIV